MSKRRHNFGTKRFKEKSLFIFHARIALKSLILLFVRLIARGARIGKTHTHTHRQDKYCNPRACAPRVNNMPYDTATATARVTPHVHCTCTSYVLYAYLYCEYALVGEAISICVRISVPFTSLCQRISRCLPQPRCLCSENVAIGWEKNSARSCSR